MLRRAQRQELVAALLEVRRARVAEAADHAGRAAGVQIALPRDLHDGVHHVAVPAGLLAIVPA